MKILLSRHEVKYPLLVAAVGLKNSLIYYVTRSQRCEIVNLCWIMSKKYFTFIIALVLLEEYTLSCLYVGFEKSFLFWVGMNPSNP